MKRIVIIASLFACTVLLSAHAGDTKTGFVDKIF